MFFAISTAVALALPAPESRDAFGKLCLAGKSGSTNPVSNSASGLIEHLVTLNNVCGFPLRLEICYRGTRRCREVEVKPRSTATVVLGYAPKTAAYFLFDYTEQKR